MVPDLYNTTLRGLRLRLSREWARRHAAVRVLLLCIAMVCCSRILLSSRLWIPYTFFRKHVKPFKKRSRRKYHSISTRHLQTIIEYVKSPCSFVAQGDKTSTVSPSCLDNCYYCTFVSYSTRDHVRKNCLAWGSRLLVSPQLSSIS